MSSKTKFPNKKDETGYRKPDLLIKITDNINRDPVACSPKPAAAFKFQNKKDFNVVLKAKDPRF